ncbi:hypothetical protein CRYUN_Cryun20dG0035200 [Craigia yunnanensis]
MGLRSMALAFMVLLFEEMRGASILPDAITFTAVLSGYILGRAGYLDEAWDFIQSMPLKPDATIWGALLRSCSIHKNMQLAEIAATKLFELEPYNSANYVLMMSLYAMSDRWGDVEHIKDLISNIGVKNGQVWSWIQNDQIIHLFSAENHPDEREIYFELNHLVSEMKKLGYKLDVKCLSE